MTTPRGALLTGSVNYDDAEKTMRTVAEILGAHFGRIPDGEVGKRFHWIMFQPDVLGEAEGIERVGAEPIPFGAGLDARPLRIADGVEAAEIALPPLGCADALLGELEQILEEIPHEDLAIQWDVASERGILEGASGYGAVM